MIVKNITPHSPKEMPREPSNSPLDFLAFSDFLISDASLLSLGSLSSSRGPAVMQSTQTSMVLGSRSSRPLVTSGRVSGPKCSGQN